MSISTEGSRNNWWFKYFQYEEGRDTPADARNVILVIVTLIAAVTFQAGVNPPGGVWQDDRSGHRAGHAIFASQTIQFYVFLVSNTVALSTSLFVLVSLMHRFHFRLEIVVATVSMGVTYGAAIFAVTPGDSVKFRYILLSATVPFVVRIMIQMFRFVLSYCRSLRTKNWVMDKNMELMVIQEASISL